ncbi:sensor histidine kinase [Salinimicrobium sp. CDJ15-81-2]|nr:sensor histidine kinase [Salinimicrobium nanhaiense]
MRDAVEVLKNQKENIINSWIREIREDVSVTRHTSRIVLRNHVPQLLDDVIGIMEKFGDFDVVQEDLIHQELFENSMEHGRHRAATKGYTLQQILREYIIFDKVISRYLSGANVQSPEAAAVIKYSIENAMLYSGIAFNESIQEVRQKFIALVAHDMRNPISAALFAMKMMKYEEGEERFELVRSMAVNSLNRSVELIEDLLDSITLEAGEGMTFNFSRQNIVECLTAVHHEAIESYSNKIIFACQKGEIEGIFDGTMVRRVIENFVSNAIKYGKENTPVTLFCIDREEMVELSVHNFGNPIPAERQKRIFNFLNTSNGSSPRGLKSRGIGLSLVKAVAEAHGGALNLHSSESEGTTFTITLQKNYHEPGKLRVALRI